MVEIKVGVVTFRYTEDNIELLLISQENTISHVIGQQRENKTIVESALENLREKTGLNLLVVSLEPVYEILQFTEVEGRKIEEKIYYFTGISDPRQSATLSDYDIEYLWVDHLGGRNTITKNIDIQAYENARNWLYENDEAPLFLANYLERLQL
ncbi:MAG: hypothetical protein HeimC2_19900 [Candidatus Heimdallarchaeota archaeon LC_2]|nr:MAG: hypothetical protein HeimC2_19900 [Candidatus Heimdallarchaeota archaeon LC_2]